MGKKEKRHPRLKEAKGRPLDQRLAFAFLLRAEIPRFFPSFQRRTSFFGIFPFFFREGTAHPLFHVERLF